MVSCCTFLLLIPEVSDSNLVSETDYPDRGVKQRSTRNNYRCCYKAMNTAILFRKYDSVLVI